MASDVTEVETRLAAPPREAPQRPHTVRPHRLRFLLIYGGLVAALVAAVVGVVVLAGESSSGSPTWSSWKPTGGGIGAAAQIARHVAPRYRLANKDQLVDVLARPPSLTQGSHTIPVQIVGVQGRNGKFGEVAQVSPTDSIMYLLCGLGQSCTIATGAPSVARGELVRREILELALYTFKYVPGIDNVLAFMPPAAAKKQAVLIYLRKSDAAAELDKPLDDSLSPTVPQVSTIAARPREVHIIDTVVTPRAFNPITLTTTPIGDSLLVLSPLRTSKSPTTP
jgi:hypothetical protein